MDDLMDPIKRTVHELPRREREAAIAAFKRAHDADPDWGLSSDRAWLEGFAAGCFETGTGEIAALRNVVQAACTQGGLAAMAATWAKYFPDHPITVAGLKDGGGVPGRVEGKAE